MAHTLATANHGCLPLDDRRIPFNDAFLELRFVLQVRYMTELTEKDPPYLVNSAILMGCREAARELGRDLDPILREYRIAPGLLTSPEGFLSHYKVINFLETVAERFDCPHFGFLAGKYQAPLQLGPVAQVVRLSPNVQSALHNGMHYAKLYSQVAKHEIVIEDGYAIFIRRDRKPFRGSAVQLHTLGLVQLFKLLKALCGEHWLPTSVSFAHMAPREKERYQRFFNCPVGFDREFDGMVFPESDLARPIETANAELLDIVCAHLDTLLAYEEKEGDVVNWVRNYINRKIGTNLCNLESCAQFFDMHPRALQRDLSSHDATFKQLLSDIRMEVAEHYLQSSALALSDLTEMLGYRNLSAFSRAFKNSHGESPEQWKKSRGLRCN